MPVLPVRAGTYPQLPKSGIADEEKWERFWKFCLMTTVQGVHFFQRQSYNPISLVFLAEFQGYSWGKKRHCQSYQGLYFVPFGVLSALRA
jgi:hypothetical protein